MEKVKVPKFPRVLLNTTVEEIDRRLQVQSDSLAPFRYDGPVGENKGWKIGAFDIPKNSLYMMRLVRDGGRGSAPGTYHRLLRMKNGQVDALVMSDTDAEMIDFLNDMKGARGHVLVGGLGMGLVLKAMMLIGKVKKITVVEVSKDLIDLVQPYVFDLARRYGIGVTIHHDDIMEWRPTPNTLFDYAWFDIWDEISPDNLPDMALLEQMYRPVMKANGKIKHWCERECHLLDQGVDPRRFYRR